MSCCGGNCGCGAGCKCGNGCGGCKMFPDVEASAGATMTTVVMATATHKGSSGGLEMAGGEESGGCDCTTCKCGTACGCSCCTCN
ncbi:metallothionein-like protein 2C [Brachypodium distachyon]|uniref:Metallothionein-like protein n=1 Tax=Brachypodium distachyon TaxID=15368 RepID=A0A0Q3IQ44_BRADI|nr:metallothionein-like protein 2C [Brachypodium distachyon]KQK07979.1 hypothetical protein BRADI_2g38765v3 [Brachypodium distachyon]|eukprot:XP_003569083.1 metallothionein-like protein 2C [Brachypodium distachyon]